MVYKKTLRNSFSKNNVQNTMEILQLENLTVTDNYKSKRDNAVEDNFRYFFDHSETRENLPLDNLPVPILLSNEIFLTETVNNSDKDLTSDHMNFINDLGESLQIWPFNEFQLDFFSEGYFGKIYKATHQPTDSIYILKVLKESDSALDNSDLGGSDSGTGDLTKDLLEYKEMFLEEIRLLSKLNHPNILKFCGVTFIEQQICYLSEYVSGGTLQELIHNHASLNVSWNDYLHIMLDIAKGMAYLHNLFIIHRDLNSKNVVMRMIDGKIKYQAIIIDFGLSYQKPDISTPEEELPVGPVGSPFHIAPELFHDVPCSTQTDVFSYGIILCEIISGCPGADPEDVPRTNDFGLNVEEFSEMASDCPAELLNLAVRCCQVKSTLRPKFADIVKIIDIILDIYCELNDEIFENSRASLDLETSMLCSCMARRKRLSYKYQNSSLKFSLPDDILDCERRFVITEDVPETESTSYSLDEPKILDHNENLTNPDEDHFESTVVERRPKLKPILKNRCSLCGGRIVLQSRDKTDAHAHTVEPSSNVNTHYGNNHYSNDSKIEKEKYIYPDKRLFPNIDPTYIKESPTKTPSTPTKDANSSKDIEINVTIPSPEHKIIEQPTTPKNDKPETLQHFSSLERSMKYPAGIFLKSNRHSLSNKTTQMASNTPGVLPRFFHQILRKRKSRILFHPGHTSHEHTPSRKILPAFLRKTFSHGSLVKLDKVHNFPEESFTRRTLTYSHSNDKMLLKNRRGSMPFNKGGFSMPGSPTRSEETMGSKFTFSCENIAEGEASDIHLDLLSRRNSAKDRHKRSRSLLNMFFKRKTSN